MGRLGVHAAWLLYYYLCCISLSYYCTLPGFDMSIYFVFLYHIITARYLVLRQLVGEEGPGAD